MIYLICTLPLISNAKTANELAAIAKDGRYIVFTVPTLKIADVGDLKRLGILTVENAIPGSSMHEAVLAASIKTQTTAENGLNSSRKRIKLDNLGRNSTALTPGSMINFAPGNMRWINGDQKKRISFANRSRDGSKSEIIIYDNNLKKINNSTNPLPLGIRGGVSCTGNDGRIIMNAWHNKVTYPPSPDNITKLEQPSAGDDFFATHIADNCHVLMSSKPKTADALTMTRRIIDIEKNKAMAVFEATRNSTNIVYGDGQYLIEQADFNRSKQPGKTAPTAMFRIYDAATGKVLKQFEIEGISSVLVKVVHFDSKYFAVLVKGFEVQILDLQTLKVTETITIPFKTFTII